MTRGAAAKRNATWAPPKATEVASLPKQGEVCDCGRDYLTLTLEESLEPCPCTRRVRVWGAWRDDEDDVRNADGRRVLGP